MGLFQYGRGEERMKRKNLACFIMELGERRRQAKEPARELNAFVDNLKQAMSNLSEDERQDVLRRLAEENS